VVVVGEAEEAPTQTSLDLRVEMPPPPDPVADRIAPVLRALDRGVERTRRESEAEARRIVAAARDEAARIRKGIEDELVSAHLGLAIPPRRDLYDLVVSTSAQLAGAPDRDEDHPATEAPRPPSDVA
jgi:hypothetical protein